MLITRIELVSPPYKGGILTTKIYEQIEDLLSICYTILHL